MHTLPKDICHGWKEHVNGFGVFFKKKSKSHHISRKIFRRKRFETQGCSSHQRHHSHISPSLFFTHSCSPRLPAFPHECVGAAGSYGNTSLSKLDLSPLFQSTATSLIMYT